MMELPRHKALVLPYGSAPFMEPGGLLWESLAHPARQHLTVFGLVSPWGLLPEGALTSPLLVHTHPQCPRRAQRDTVARVRAWLDMQSNRFGKVVLVAYGPMMRPWSIAVEGSPLAGRVQILKATSLSRGLSSSVLRRQIKDAALA